MADEMHDLSRFALADMVQVGRALRVQARASASVEEFAGRLTDYLYDGLVSASGERQTVLVRCFLTLDGARVAELTGAPPHRTGPRGAGAQFLALLASRGTEAAWNDRRDSVGHQAIPLDPESMSAAPMVAALVSRLRGTAEANRGDATIFADPADVHFGVFHVQTAPASPFVPAQDFVLGHGVASVVGFGGVLPDGELFAVLVFANVTVSAEVAALFRTVSLNVRLAMLELDAAPLTARDADAGADRPGRQPGALRGRTPGPRRQRAERAVLEQLIHVHQSTAVVESERARAAVARWRAEAERANALAATLQQSLLPAALPDLPGLDVAGLFRPAGDGAQIGGDFYDVFTTQPGSAWFVVGDVAGKGADAAALTSFARHTLRAVASSALATPASCLRRLNAVALAHASGRHLTAVVGLFHLEPGHAARLTLALAGHPRPLLVHADATVSPVGEPGTAVGMFDTVDITDAHLVVRPGETLVAFTDGVTEARGPQRELFDDDRLAELLAGSCGLAPGAVTERVAASVLAFQGGWAADDIAVLAMAPRP